MLAHSFQAIIPVTKTDSLSQHVLSAKLVSPYWFTSGNSSVAVRSTISVPQFTVQCNYAPYLMWYPSNPMGHQAVFLLTASVPICLLGMRNFHRTDSNFLIYIKFLMFLWQSLTYKKDWKDCGVICLGLQWVWTDSFAGNLSPMSHHNDSEV